MSIPRIEQETTISVHYGDNLVRLFTSHPPTARKWQKQGAPVTVFGSQDGEAHSWAATLPIGEFASRVKRAKRRLSPEHKAALGAQLMAARRKKRANTTTTILTPPDAT